MKYLKFFCFLILLSLSNDASAMLSRDLDDVHAKDLHLFIKKNFKANTEGFLHPHTPQAKEITKFIPYFLYDSELKIMAAKSLFEEIEGSDQGLLLCAQTIVIEDCYNSQFKNTNLDNSKFLLHIQNLYLNQLKKCYPENHTKDLNNILQFLSGPDNNILNEYAGGNKIILGNINRNKDKKITKNSCQGVGIKNSLVNKCKPILIALNEQDSSFHFDAFFISVINHPSFEEKDCFGILPNLTYQLYSYFSEKNLRLPHSLKLAYAKHYLIPKKEYESAISLCDSVLGKQEQPTNFFQTPENYTILGFILALKENYKRSQEVFTQALALSENNDPRLHWNLAYANIMYENYDTHSLEIMKKIVNLSREEKVNHRINSSIANSTYQYALEKAGKTDELDDFLKEKQQKFIKKAKKQAEQIKEFLKEQKKQNQERQSRLKLTTTPKEIQPPHAALTTSTTTTTTTSTSNVTSVASSSLEDVLPQKKEKKKTKGSPNRHIAPIQEEEPTLVRQSFIYVENITKNNNVLNIFRKLFSLYAQKKNCFNNQVKISLHEINTLFEALHQQVDPSQGKGSHKKVALNFQEFGSMMEDQMIILTNATFLKEYQIEQIRDAFINAGIVPDDKDVLAVIEKL